MDVEGQLGILLCAILYTKPEDPWIVVPMLLLEPIFHGYLGTTKFGGSEKLHVIFFFIPEEGARAPNPFVVQGQPFLTNACTGSRKD